MPNIYGGKWNGRTEVAIKKTGISLETDSTDQSVIEREALMKTVAPPLEPGILKLQI